MASTTAIIRSAGAPGTAVADWKAVTVEQFAVFIQAGASKPLVATERGAVEFSYVSMGKRRHHVHDQSDRLVVAEYGSRDPRSVIRAGPARR